MRYPIQLLSAILPLLFGPAHAQQGPGEPPSGLARLMASSCGLTPGDGSCWATGPQYAAEIGPVGLRWQGQRGVTVFELEVLEVQRGGSTWTAPAAGQIGIDAHNPRLGQRALWPTVSERFEAKPEGLEHSLLFEGPVGTDGELVVRLNLESEHQALLEGQELLLVDDTGTAIVRFGGVTGIDAAGRTCTGSLRLVADQLEYVLPDAFLAEATWPVLLDPLIGSSITVSLVPQAYSVALAHSGTSNNYLVAWANSIGNLVAQRYDISTFSAQGGQLALDSTGRAEAVVAGWCRLPNRFLVVWAQDDLANDADLIARTVDATNGALGSVGALLFTPGGSELPYDLSNETTTADNELLLAYRSTTGAYTLRQVNVPTSGIPALAGTAVILGTAPLGSPIEAGVHISSQGGSANTYLAAWAELAGANTGAVVVRAFDRNALALSNDLTLQTVSLLTTRLGRPDVDGDGKRFAVAWDQDGQTPGVASLLRGATVEFNPLIGTILQAVAPKTMVTGPLSTNKGLVGTSIAWTPEGVIAGYSEFSGADSFSYAYDGRLSHFDSGTLNLIEGPTVVPALINSLVTSQLSGSDAAAITDSDLVDEAVLPSFDGASSVPFTPDPGILRLRRFGTFGRTQELGGGCGKGGFAWANGALLGKTLRIHLDTDQITGTSYALLGQSFAGLPCGACSLLVDPTGMLLSAFSLPGSGNATIALGVPINLALSGVGITAQWATPVADPLCSVLGCDFSNAIRITLQ
jgi:hypothetical protein